MELDNINAPIEKGSVVGKLSYTIDGINYTTNLIAGQDIFSSSIFSIVFKILVIITILYLLKTIFIGKNKKKKRKKKNNKKKKQSSKDRFSPYRFDY